MMSERHTTENMSPYKATNADDFFLRSEILKSEMPRHHNSRRWLAEHHNDPYVKQARAAGYRSRAAFKLLEIDERDRLLRPGMVVVDLGAAPGGFSQVAAERVAAGREGGGEVIALDLLPMSPVPGVEFIEGDFREQAVCDALLARLAGRSVDLVISDMAPNISGMRAIDQPRSMYLVELAVDFAAKVLRRGGTLLVKAFQGEGFQALVKDLHQHYDKVRIRKPRPSRDRSREVYVLARRYHGER